MTKILVELLFAFGAAAAVVPHLASAPATDHKRD